MLFQLWTFSCWARVRGQLGLRTGWVKGRGSGSQVLLGCSSHFWEGQQNVDWQKQILQTQGKYIMHLHISFSIWTDFNNKEVQFGSILTIKRLDLGQAFGETWWNFTQMCGFTMSHSFKLVNWTLGPSKPLVLILKSTISGGISKSREPQNAKTMVKYSLVKSTIFWVPDFETYPNVMGSYSISTLGLNPKLFHFGGDLESTGCFYSNFDIHQGPK